MKLDSRALLKQAKRPSGPLRTFREIADEFGVPPSVLNHIMGTSKVEPPKTWSKHKSSSSENSYYELNAMRAWWRSYRALKESA